MKRNRITAWAFALLLVGTLFAAPVRAEEPSGTPDTSASGDQTDAAEERATAFQGVRGPEAESVPGGALLLGAYAVVWVLLFLYLMRMRRLQRHTAEELERLSTDVMAAEGR